MNVFNQIKKKEFLYPMHIFFWNSIKIQIQDRICFCFDVSQQNINKLW